MDIWSLLAGLGTVSAGIQAAKDKARKVQIENEERQWLQQQRERMKQEWKYNDAMRPLREQEAKLRMEELQRKIMRQRLADDFNYNETTPIAPTSQAGNEIGAAMASAAGAPVAGVAVASSLNTPVKRERLVPYDVQKLEDKRLAQLNDIQQRLELQHRAQDIRSQNLELQKQRMLMAGVKQGVIAPSEADAFMEEGPSLIAPPQKQGGRGRAGDHNRDVLAQYNTMRKQFIESRYAEPTPEEDAVLRQRAKEVVDYFYGIAPAAPANTTQAGPNPMTEKIGKMLIEGYQKMSKGL